MQYFLSQIFWNLHNNYPGNSNDYMVSRCFQRWLWSGAFILVGAARVTILKGIVMTSIEASDLLSTFSAAPGANCGIVGDSQNLVLDSQSKFAIWNSELHLTQSRPTMRDKHTFFTASTKFASKTSSAFTILLQLFRHIFSNPDSSSFSKSWCF